MHHDTDPTNPQRPPEAATDIPALLADLDAGVFELVLSTAISKVAAAVATLEGKPRKGNVRVDFVFERIDGTRQVRCEHKVRFEAPSRSGRAMEEDTRATVLYVGRGGALSLAQPLLPGMEQRQGSLPA